MKIETLSLNKLGLTLAMVLWMSACSQSNNDFSLVADTCGLASSDIAPGKTFVQFTDSNGTPLFGPGLRMQDTELSGLVIEASEKGCVPKDKLADVRVVSFPSRNLGVILTEDLGEGASFEKVALTSFQYEETINTCTPMITNQDSLIMPIVPDGLRTEGYQTLVSILGGAENEPLSWRLDNDNNGAYSLFLQELQDNAYDVSIQFTQLHSRDQLTSQFACRVLVDKTMPEASLSLLSLRLDSSAEEIVWLDEASQIEFVVDSGLTQTSLFICWKNEENAAQACNFAKAPSSGIPSPPAGRWTLYYFAEDAAGNRTEVATKTVHTFELQEQKKMQTALSLSQSRLDSGHYLEAFKEMTDAFHIYSGLAPISKFDELENSISDLYLELATLPVPVWQQKLGDEGKRILGWTSQAKIKISSLLSNREACQFVDLENGKIHQDCSFGGEGYFKFDGQSLTYLPQAEGFQGAESYDALELIQTYSVGESERYALAKVRTTDTEVPGTDILLIDAKRNRERRLETGFSFEFVTLSNDRPGLLLLEEGIANQKLIAKVIDLNDFREDREEQERLQGYQYWSRAKRSIQYDSTAQLLVEQDGENWSLWHRGRIVSINLSFEPRRLVSSVDGDIVGISSGNGRLEVFSSQTGDLLAANINLRNTKDFTLGKELVATLQEDGDVFVYDLFGNRRHEFSLSGSWYRTIHMGADHYLAMESANGTLTVYDLGRTLADSFSTRGQVTSLLSVADGFLFRSHYQNYQSGRSFTEAISFIDATGALIQNDQSITSNVTATFSGSDSLSRNLKLFEMNGETHVLSPQTVLGINAWILDDLSAGPVFEAEAWTFDTYYLNAITMHPSSQSYAFATTDGLIYYGKLDVSGFKADNPALMSEDFSEPGLFAKTLMFSKTDPTILFATNSENAIHKFSVDYDENRAETLKRVDFDGGISFLEYQPGTTNFIAGDSTGNLMILTADLEIERSLDLNPDARLSLTNMAIDVRGRIYVGSYDGQLKIVEADLSSYRSVDLFSDQFGPKQVVYSDQLNRLAVSVRGRIFLLDIQTIDQLERICHWINEKKPMVRAALGMTAPCS